MHKLALLLGIPLAVSVAITVIGNLVEWREGNSLSLLGLVASGLLAGRLAGWKTGVGAAAMYLALTFVFLVIGLALTDPAHFS